MRSVRNPLPSFLSDGKAAASWLLTTDDRYVRKLIDNEVNALKEEEWPDDEIVETFIDVCGKYVEFAKSAFDTPDGIVVYRALCLDQKENIYWDSIGAFWSVKLDAADCYGHAMHGTFDTVFIVKAVVRPSDINWGKSLALFVVYEHVWEIRVKDYANVIVVDLFEKVGLDREATVIDRDFPFIANVGPTQEWE